MLKICCILSGGTQFGSHKRVCALIILAMRLLNTAIAAAVLAFAPFATAAANASDHDNWSAAIAVSPSTGSIGTISGPATRRIEEGFAKEICARNGAADCMIVTSFTDTCATVAKGMKAAKGDDGKEVREAQFFTELGGDDETDEREIRVLDACKAGAQDCALVTTYCAG
ncbi:hypothetical protein Srot_1776 [Segniliparus rotundus DSM 44985]|uniref:DUF4189 domain-containing protein n=2 Tax=Segniliparus rotundus TaxID=286802 RepID=D6Z8F6_SEGRD|nr:hypothetical protein Srot_1776 [Segniliparus rotundus DSM 44985]